MYVFLQRTRFPVQYVRMETPVEVLESCVSLCTRLRQCESDLVALGSSTAHVHGVSTRHSRVSCSTLVKVIETAQRVGDMLPINRHRLSLRYRPRGNIFTVLLHIH